VPLTRTAQGKVWERDFNGRVFRAYLSRSSEPQRKERF
jgi:hypothetical protein